MNDNNLIEVGMGDMKMVSAPRRLITRALGSCLGITFYSPQIKSGAMAHPMLPDIDKAKMKSNPNRYVNSVIIRTLDEMEKLGVLKNGLEIKIFGGAHMFSFITADSLLNVGEKNIEVAKELLGKLGLKIIAEEVGGTFGRTIELNLENGKVFVDTVSWGRKEV
ncbi:MAG TPA: chemotaxis protein CheD [Candidatus Omnitrophota bacterium]|nr:chemotaxis protein CheD [Candidatus Omnitrophota bacterium]